MANTFSQRRASWRERWGAFALGGIPAAAPAREQIESAVGRFLTDVSPAAGEPVPRFARRAEALGRELAALGVDLPGLLDLGERLAGAFAEPAAAAEPGGPGEDGAPLPATFLAGLVRGHAGMTAAGAANGQTDGVTSEEALLTRLAELEALQQVTTATSSALDLDATLQLTVLSVASVTRADICTIYLYEEERGQLVLSASTGFPRELVGRVRLRLGEGITGVAAQEARVIALRDAWADPRFKRFPWLDEHPYRSMASVPIFVHNQRKLIGVLNIQTRHFRDYSPEAIRFLETVARQVGIAIENARLYALTDERLGQKVNELTTLIRVSSAITSTLDVQEVLDLIASQTVVLTGMDMAAIFELDEPNDMLSVTASYGLSQEFVATARVPIGEATAGLVVRDRRPIRVSDVRQSAYSPQWRAVAEEEGYRSVVGVPLVSRRRVLGTLLAYSREVRDLSDDLVELLSAFANEAAIAIDNARLYQEARRALATKSALLQEMHHRVKNNLQTVAALLSLQARRTASAEAAQPLRDSVARIESIAAVHDLLSQDSLGWTTFEALGRQIIEVASASLIEPGKRITFAIEGGEVRFASKEATVLALLLNELVANAVLHGLAERRRGHITLAAEAGDGSATLRVRDDGAGLPAGFDVRAHKGLGLQICETLVSNDLRGAFTIEPAPEGGAVATIKVRRSDAIVLL